MPIDDEEFRRALLATFAVEADEHITAVERALVGLEKAGPGGDARGFVEIAFREVHSLKGAARAVDFRATEALCHRLESTFDSLADGAAFSTGDFDVLHAATEMIQDLIRAESGEGAFPEPADLQALEGRIELLTVPEDRREQPAAAPAVDTRPAREAPQAGPESTVVRVNRQELNTLLLGAEGFVVGSMAANHSKSMIDELGAMVRNHRRNRSRGAKRVGWLQRSSRTGAPEETARLSQRHAELLDLIKEDEQLLVQLERRLGSLTREFSRQHETLTKEARHLIETARRLSMLPVSTLSDGFPKIVRDLARDLGKQVEFTVIGDAVQVDRRILEQIKDPLIHLLRNAVGHGVETAADRVAQGKNPAGSLTLSVSPAEQSFLEITLQDDGAGIDVDKVRQSAARSEPENAEAFARLEAADAVDLIFRPRVSTSQMITDVSGRGMGLAVVREKIERLGGSVMVTTHPGMGTAFRLRIPSHLYGFKGLQVRCAGKGFLLPLSAVERVFRVKPTALAWVDGTRTLRHRERSIPVYSLASLLGLGNSAGTDSPQISLVLLAVGERHLAIEVHEIVGQEEAMVKSIGHLLGDEQLVAGASTLPNGQHVVLLDPYELVKLAHQAAGLAARAAGPGQDGSGRSRRVLVADDSITSRMLIKATLEAEGYAVTTAVDGKDALEKLARDRFDLVVTDIEMPRINGFELTRRVRKNPDHQDIPVVLVTSLSSAADQERGLAAGANAYLVKSDFSDGNLMDVLGRLA